MLSVILHIVVGVLLVVGSVAVIYANTDFYQGVSNDTEKGADE